MVRSHIAVVATTSSSHVIASGIPAATSASDESNFDDSCRTDFRLKSGRLSDVGYLTQSLRGSSSGTTLIYLTTCLVRLAPNICLAIAYGTMQQRSYLCQLLDRYTPMSATGQATAEMGGQQQQLECGIQWAWPLIPRQEIYT